MRGPLSARRRLACVVAASLLAISCPPARAEDAFPPAPDWPRVMIQDSTTAKAVRAALDAAAHRLEAPACRAVLSARGFQDGAGQPLETKLTGLRTEAPAYLALLLFVDGRATRPCRTGTAVAYTEPGARVVFVCGRRFHEAWQRSAAHAEAAIIHEVLHTLGLGENPPTSEAITATVRSYCAQ